MAGNPNWSSNTHQPQPLFSSQYFNNNNNNINVCSDSSLALDSLADHHCQDPPTSQSSWTQFLLSSSISRTTEEDNNNNNNNDNNNLTQFQPNRKLFEINWEDQMILSSTVINPPPIYKLFDINENEKQEVYSVTKSNLYGEGEHDHHDYEEFQENRSSTSNNNIFALISYFNNYNKPDFGSNQTTDDHSSECNSTDTGVSVSNKKPRVQPSSQPPLKVRKEKLGDRITGLHQLVSPFGKTDTASVLFEAIGYIRFLQSQIEALSAAYLGHASKNLRDDNQQNVEVEAGGGKESQRDLKSKGLCLVPVSCTHQVGSDNGADYWTPSNYPPNGF